MLIYELLESFDTATYFDWTKTVTGYKAETTINDIEVKLRATEHNLADINTLHVWFETKSKYSAYHTTIRTNTHSTPPMKIFGAVTRALTTLINNVEPDAVAFYVASEDANTARQSIYQRIVTKFNTRYPNQRTMQNKYGDIITVLYNDKAKNNEQQFLKQVLSEIE